MSTLNDKDRLKSAQLRNRNFDLDCMKKTFLSGDFDIKSQWSFSSSDHNYNVLHYFVSVKYVYYCQHRPAHDLFLESLIERGADITCKNNKNYTPVRLAYQRLSNISNILATIDSRNVINIMLKAHRTFNIRENPCCDDGISHLHIACLANNFDIVKFFLEANFSVHEAINSSARIFPGYSLIHLAMETEDAKMIDLLLKHGADVNRLNANGKSALHLLIEKQITYVLSTKSQKIREDKLKNFSQIMNAILKKCKRNLIKVDDVGFSLFHACCTSVKNFKFMEFDELLKKGRACINKHVINLNSPVWAGYCPLHFAAICNLETLVLLLKNGANLMSKDKHGKTPLDLCLGRYEPSDISRVLETQKQFRSIKLESGEKLTDVLCKFTADELDNYLAQTANINNAITKDSSLWSGFTLLHLAVILSSDKDKFRVSLCLNHGADILHQDTNGMTALHLAFRLVKKKCITEILNSHKNIIHNPVDHKNLSHFLIACTAYNQNQKKVVQAFLDSGMDPNVSTQTDTSLTFIVKFVDNADFQNYTTIPAGSTPLHIAVAIGYEKLIDLLFEYGANPDIVDADGFTWVQRAFLNSRFRRFEGLLWRRNGAPKTNPVAPGGLSNLHIACYTGSLEMVKALQPFAANINEPLTEELMKHVENLPEDVYIGDTALHMAVKADVKCNKDLTEFLLKKGADVEARNSKGLSPLHEALLTAPNSATAKLLAKKFFDKNKRETKKGLTVRKLKETNGQPTRLHIACALGDVALVKKLLDSGEDIYSRTDRDSSIWPDLMPLDVAIQYERWVEGNTVDLLLNHIVKQLQDSASVNKPLHGSTKRRRITRSQGQRFVVNQDGLSAFHVSCMRNDAEIVEKFLELGADVNAPVDYFASSNAGYTPLHLAIQYGSKEIVTLLLKYGASVYVEDSNSNNSLYLAILKRPSLIKTLLREFKVDVTVKNTFGDTFLDVILRESNLNSRSDIYLAVLEYCVGMENIELATKMSLVKKLTRNFFGDTYKCAINCIPKVDEIDARGRNAIHHLFLPDNLPDFGGHQKDFAENFEYLIKNGCELDLQDITGRTPFHYSVITQCENKVKSLLLAGADINIIDKKGKTPYMYNIDERKKNYNWDRIHGVLHRYVEKCIISGLNVSPENQAYYEQIGESLNKCYFLRDLDLMKRLKIRYKSFSCRNLVTKEIVTEFPVMPLCQYDKILRILESDELIKRFPDWLLLFRLQRRKMLKRKELFVPTMTFLRKILDQRLPDHCLEYILANLETEDWNNLLRSRKRKQKK